MSSLAVILPGSGYGPDGPVLLVPALALEERGATVVRVRYPDWRPDGWTPAAMAPFVDEVRRATATAIAAVAEPTGGWRRVTVVAKSLGTLVLSLMDGPVVETAEHRAVWLTPLLGCDNPGLDEASRRRLVAAAPAQRAGVIAKGWRSLIVAGSADPYHDAAAHDAVVTATDAVSLVLPDGDHALHVHRGDGTVDVVATVEGFRRLADAVLRFDGM